MNSKHPDNDIDSIFKDAIDPAETEPSDRFWNRAFEDIIKRENKVYGKQMRRWKTISYLLGAAIILLALYTSYIHSRINNVEKQIAEVEKRQDISTGNENIPGTTTEAAANKTASTLDEHENANHESGEAATAAGKSYTIASATNNNYGTINKNISAEQHEQEESTRINPNNSNPGSNNVGTEKNPLNGSYGFGSTTPPGNYYNDTTGKTTTLSENTKSAVTPSSPDSTHAVKNDTPSTVQQNENMPLATTKTGDTTKPLTKTKKPIPSKSFLSHIYVLAYFSPEISKNIITVNNTTDNEIVNAIKTGETQEATFSTGIKIGYDLSKHWSILTGAYYHAASFSLLSRVVYANAGNAANYSIITGNGTLQMPSYINQYTNDSLKVSGTSSWAYVGIPLQARYDFLPGSKLDFYAEAGFAANFLTSTSTTLNWEGSWGSGPCTIPDYKGLQSVFFVYNLGVGATYNFTKGFSFFVEPGMQGPITAITRNSSVTNYPYIMDLTLGLTYHF